MKRALLIALLVSAAASAQQPGTYVGVASCVNSGCHGSTQPLNATRVLQNEYYTWLNLDRHAGAYNVLFNDRSARIVKNMRLKRKAYQEAVCLDCHSTNVPAAQVSGRIDLEDGVQCEACHGPAGGWRNEHTQPGWTHEQSVQRGMIDLRAIPIRATTCDACHVGGRRAEVDHELIASGHPLLAFELDNYTERMPPHWTRPRATHGVPAWAVGQAVQLRDALDNLARHARGEKWPEFSAMSCYNCHHSLESSGWRQERGWPGRAGLPAWSPQHWAVLRLILNRANAAPLDGLIATVSTRVARMNDPAGVASAADEARRAVDNAIPAVAKLTWRDDDVRSMIRTIAGDDGLTTYDVHSAEQTALALQSLAAALARSDRRVLKSPLMAAIDALFDEVKNRDRYDPARFAEKLRAVRAAV
jgi:Cytochrome c554 and c-prime